MDGARKFVVKVFHSGGWKPGDQQPPDTQQPGGEHGQQPNTQLPEQGFGKGSVRRTFRSLSPFTKPARSDLEAITTGQARPPPQADTIASGILAPARSRVDIAASSKSLIPPGQDPVLSNSESQHPPDTPTHPPSDATDRADIMPHVHLPSPQEAASNGKPEVLATAILALNPPGIVINTIAPIDPSFQTWDPVSASTSDPHSVSRANHSPGTVPPTISSDLWQRALGIAQESLTKYKLPSLELGSLQSQSATENIQSLVAELETAHRENKDRHWRYKDRDGNEVAWVERLGKILKGVDKYAKIVDTAIQHHPDITSLVWATARTILQVCRGLGRKHCSSLIYIRLL